MSNIVLLPIFRIRADINALLTMYVSDNYDKLWMDSTEIPLDISVQLFLIFHANAHFIYFNTVQAFFDIQFTPWYQI